MGGGAAGGWLLLCLPCSHVYTCLGLCFERRPHPPYSPLLSWQAKDAAAGIGAAVAAAGGAALPAAAAAGGEMFSLVVRCERSVQEVAVVATCGREELRQLVASSIAQLAAEAAERVS